MRAVRRAFKQLAEASLIATHKNLTCCASATKSETKHSHRNSTFTFGAINIRIVSEKVRHGFRGVAKPIWDVVAHCVGGRSHWCELVVQECKIRLRVNGRYSMQTRKPGAKGVTEICSNNQKRRRKWQVAEKAVGIRREIVKDGS